MQYSQLDRKRGKYNFAVLVHEQSKRQSLLLHCNCASGSSSKFEAKMVRKESRGLPGLGIGRRPKLAHGGKTKIPSVLFIEKTKDESMN